MCKFAILCERNSEVKITTKFTSFLGKYLLLINLFS